MIPTTASTTSPRQLRDSAWLTRWSLWMLPAFIAVYVITSFAWLYVVFPILGLREGDVVLFAHSVGGWIAAVIGWALLAVAPVAGVVLAVNALHRGGRVGSWMVLILNCISALLVAYIVFDEIRMTYFPQITFPFSG